MTLEHLEERTNHIGSTVFAPEQELWLRYLTNIMEGGDILDLGTGWGKSASSLGLICPKADIITIDWGDEYTNEYRTEDEYISQVEKNIAKSGAKNVQFIKVKYQDFQLRDDIILEALNVDVPANIEPYSDCIIKFVPQVKTGGYIFFHSYIHPYTSEPREAINNLSEKIGMEMVEVSRPAFVGGETLRSAVFRKL